MEFFASVEDASHDLFREKSKAFTSHHAKRKVAKNGTKRNHLIEKMGDDDVMLTYLTCQ